MAGPADSSCARSWRECEGTDEVTFAAEVLPDMATASARAIEGVGQRAVAGEPLDDPLTLELTDSLGNPLAGVEVTWSFSSGQGHDAAASDATAAETLTLVTGEDGRSSVRWQVGTDAGPQHASATVARPEAAASAAEGSSAMAQTADVTFDTPVDPGRPTELGLNPKRESVDVGESASFSVSPRDEFGNTVSDLQIAWTTSSSSVASVDATGVLTAKTPGVVTLTARAASLVESATVEVTSTSKVGKLWL